MLGFWVAVSGVILLMFSPWPKLNCPDSWWQCLVLFSKRLQDFRASGEAILGIYIKLVFTTIFLMSVFRTPGEAILGTHRHLSTQLFIQFVRTSHEAILGTQRYFSNQFLIKNCSCLRRGDLRYTTILFKQFLIEIRWKSKETN